KIAYQPPMQHMKSARGASACRAVVRRATDQDCIVRGAASYCACPAGFLGACGPNRAAVAAILTLLSLSHLADGIRIVTHAETWQSWSMAAGVDLAYASLETALLAIGDRLRRQVACYAKPAIVLTLVASAGMNAAAFGAQAEGYAMVAAAIAL